MDLINNAQQIITELQASLYNFLINRVGRMQLAKEREIKDWCIGSLD